MQSRNGGESASFLIITAWILLSRWDARRIQSLDCTLMERVLSDWKIHYYLNARHIESSIRSITLQLDKSTDASPALSRVPAHGSRECLLLAFASSRTFPGHSNTS